jgi:hypothetical protein
LLPSDAEFFDAPSGALIYLCLIVSASNNTKHQENTLGQQNGTFRCQFCQNLILQKTTLFTSTDVEFQAVQNTLHYES